MTMFLQTPQVYGEMQEQLIHSAEVRPVYNTFRVSVRPRTYALLDINARSEMASSSLRTPPPKFRSSKQ